MSIAREINEYEEENWKRNEINEIVDNEKIEKNTKIWKLKNIIYTNSKWLERSNSKWNHGKTKRK